MKKIAVIVALGLFFSTESIAQLNADQLIRINNVTNATEMNNISSPHEGSLLYLESKDNLYIRNGNRWNTIWTNQGNIATDSCFIGPISNHDFRFRTNNNPRLIIKNDGKVGVNLDNPSGIFQVNTASAISNINLSLSGTASTNSISSGSPANAIDNFNSNWWSDVVAFHWVDVWFRIDLGAGQEEVVNRYEIVSGFSNGHLPTY